MKVLEFPVSLIFFARKITNDGVSIMMLKHSLQGWCEQHQPGTSGNATSDAILY